MACELANLIPLQFKRGIYTLDQERYDLAKAIVKNSGSITHKDFLSSKVESLMTYSIIFPGVYNNQSVLVMPLELVNTFSHANGDLPTGTVLVGIKISNGKPVITRRTKSLVRWPIKVLDFCKNKNMSSFLVI